MKDKQHYQSDPDAWDWTDGTVADLLNRASCGSSVQWRKNLELPADAHED